MEVEQKNEVIIGIVFLFFVFASILLIVYFLSISETKDNSISVSDNFIDCYRCTTRTDDGNACEKFVHQGFSCPQFSTSTPNACADLFFGFCPSSGTLCYRCTSQVDDNDLCESFISQTENCPAGSSKDPFECKLAVGGFCPKEITCYKCTDRTDDGDTCESFSVIASNCPDGSSTTPTGCAASEGGSCFSVSVECGPIDVDGDNKLTLIDLVAFKALYGKKCNISPVSFPSQTSCGPKDTNNNGIIDIADFSSFQSRYLAPTCFIP